MQSIDPNKAPYKVSRAAERQAFGARSINASAPNVADKQNFGTVGREKWAMKDGRTNDDQWKGFFNQPFKPRYSTGPIDQQLGKISSMARSATQSTALGGLSIPTPVPSLAPSVQPDLNLAASVFKPKFSTQNPMAQTSSAYLKRLGIDPDITRRISQLDL